MLRHSGPTQTSCIPKPQVITIFVFISKRPPIIFYIRLNCRSICLCVWRALPHKVRNVHPQKEWTHVKSHRNACHFQFYLSQFSNCVSKTFPNTFVSAELYHLLNTITKLSLLVYLVSNPWSSLIFWKTRKMLLAKIRYIFRRISVDFFFNGKFLLFVRPNRCGRKFWCAVNGVKYGTYCWRKMKKKNRKVDEFFSESYIMCISYES